MTEQLLLKWGTVKGWEGLSEQSIKIIKRYFADGVPLSSVADHPDDYRKAILCELIDQLTGTIQNDWTGEIMTKDAAKAYIIEY